MIRFVNILKANLASVEDDRENGLNFEMLMEDDEHEKESIICFCIPWKDFILVWKCFMSNVHWFNLISTPLVMLWPELFPLPSISLWLSEFFFLMNIIIKCFTKKPHSMASDNYDIFVEYLKTNFILDLISTVPNSFSGMNIVFAPLKLTRIYEIDQLHFLITQVMYCVKHDKS